PSPWGPNNQTGATNRVTAGVTKAAAAEIQEGKVVPMSYPLADGVPLFGTRFTKTILTATSLAPGASFGENQLTYMEDTWLSQSHVGTHLDGMGHIGRKDCYFNQTPMGKYINQNSITKLGLEHLKSFATRGVLIDAVKVFQAAGKLKSNPGCTKPCLDKGTVITRADLEAGLMLYSVTLREGDIVIIHTGWGNLFEQYPKQNALFNSGEPGIGKDAANWLVSQKIVAGGAVRAQAVCGRRGGGGAPCRRRGRRAGAAVHGGLRESHGGADRDPRGHRLHRSRPARKLRPRSTTPAGRDGLLRQRAEQPP